MDRSGPRSEAGGRVPRWPVRAPGLVGVVLAAGAGRRLAPLTDLVPKALCPVGNRSLVDLALARVAPVVDQVAVNLHHGRVALAAHLGAHHPDVHRSVEAPEALGTAGALGALRGWIAGRGVLVHNVDVWAEPDLAGFVAGWDGQRVRVLVVAPSGPAASFGPRSGLVATLLGWSDVADLSPEPAGLYETTLAGAQAQGRLDVVAHRGTFVDCGTPADYLRANLLAAAAAAASAGAVGGEAGGSIVGEGSVVRGQVVGSVIGPGCRVAGEVRRSVLWAGAEVGPHERLEDVIRAPGLAADVRADAW